MSGGKFRVLTLHNAFHRILLQFITCSCKVLLGQRANDDACFFFPEHPDGVIRIEVLGTPAAKG